MSHVLQCCVDACPHCVTMPELVARLEKEEGIKVESLEVWHNPKNEKRLLALDKDLCGGVPFFYNLKSNKWLCGEVNYEELKEWAN